MLTKTKLRIITPMEVHTHAPTPPKLDAGDSDTGCRAKMNQIVPSGRTTKTLKRVKLQQSVEQEITRSFSTAFGVLGLPMLAILIVCITWTSWLVFLALAPNNAANWLMETGDYDNGEFWLIDDASPRTILAGAVGLIVVDTCYLVVLLRMLFWHTKMLDSAFVEQSDDFTTSEGESTTWLACVTPYYRRTLVLWSDLTSFKGKNRKKWNAFLKMIDLAVEMTMLRQLLHSGSPASLTYGFAGFLAVNSMSCVVNVLTDRFSALTEVFIDSIFDLAAAVLFPIVTLIYCYYNFDFDRVLYLTNLEMLPPGSFEHLARSFADPAEVALFRVTFDSLRIQSALDFAVRISMNLTSCYRFERVLVAVACTRQEEGSLRRRKATTCVPVSQDPVPKGVTAVFLAISIVVLLATNKVISDSTALCSAYPECVVYAHRWETSEDHCPCLIVIDVDFAPKTYEEWINPVNAYDKVKALAASGMLTSLQVINRQLLEFPEEIRSCSNLKNIHLMYTSTQQVPGWAKELQSLETIHIEGKYGSQNLRELPDDLFINLPRLSTIHLGIHFDLSQLPAFTGIPHLRSVSLAWLNQIRELPSLERVPGLSRLLMSIMPRLERLPDLSPLKELVEFVILGPSYLCCNGFIGHCDLNHVSCRTNPLMKTLTTTCLDHVPPFLGSVATQKVFDKFSSAICQESVFEKTGFLLFPTKETIDMCGGKLFRKCYLPGNLTGICYNPRFQVISCVPDQTYITLRRTEIEREIGPKCDPVEEKWLGCAE